MYNRLLILNIHEIKKLLCVACFATCMWLALLSTEIEDAEEELAALLCRDVIDDGRLCLAILSL